MEKWTAAEAEKPKGRTAEIARTERKTAEKARTEKEDRSGNRTEGKTPSRPETSPEHAGGGQRQLDDVPPVPECFSQGELGLGPVVSLGEVDVRSEEEEHEEVTETGSQGGAVESPTQVVDEQPAVSMLLGKSGVLGFELAVPFELQNLLGKSRVI
jgi:hypothetical protein